MARDKNAIDGRSFEGGVLGPGGRIQADATFSELGGRVHMHNHRCGIDSPLMSRPNDPIFVPQIWDRQAPMLGRGTCLTTTAMIAWHGVGYLHLEWEPGKEGSDNLGTYNIAPQYCRKYSTAPFVSGTFWKGEESIE
jgi:hypothetical protein